MTDAPRTLPQRIAELERLMAENPQAPYVWMHRFANAAPAILARVRELEQALRELADIADHVGDHENIGIMDRYIENARAALKPGATGGDK